MKKIKISSELAYLIGLVLLAFAVSMITTASFGVSMLIAPSLILSKKFVFLSFGQWEYVLQGILFIIMCIWAKKIKPIYVFAFLSSIAFGTFLDLFLKLPIYNPAFYGINEFNIAFRIGFFAVAEILIGIALAFSFKSYLYPQTTDFFVKCITGIYKYNLSKFKLIFDIAFLTLSVALTLILFKSFVGLGVGTIIITFLNGPMIGVFGKILDKFFVFTPTFKKLEKVFEL